MTLSAIGELIRGARLAAGLTQSEVAARTGMRQPNVARAETAAHAPSVATCERLLRAAGYRLAVLPAITTDVFTIATAIRDAVQRDSDDTAYRLVIQLADDLARLHGAERVAAAVAPPPPSGDERYDALIAGVVETRLDEEHLPHPRWLSAVPSLDAPWYVDAQSAGRRRVDAATPPALRRRGVLIDASELVSA